MTDTTNLSCTLLSGSRMQIATFRTFPSARPSCNTSEEGFIDRQITLQKVCAQRMKEVNVDQVKTFKRK